MILHVLTRFYLKTHSLGQKNGRIVNQNVEWLMCVCVRACAQDERYLISSRRHEAIFSQTGKFIVFASISLYCHGNQNITNYVQYYDSC